MAKNQSTFTPITEAFKEKLMAAVNTEKPGEAIKKAVDEFMKEIEKNIKYLHKPSK